MCYRASERANEQALILCYCEQQALKTVILEASERVCVFIVEFISVVIATIRGRRRSVVLLLRFELHILSCRTEKTAAVVSFLSFRCGSYHLASSEKKVDIEESKGNA